MATTPEVTLNEGTLQVSGAMTLAHATTLEKKGLALLRRHRLVAARVDLSATSELDSSALAILFSWQREQKRQTGTLTIVAAPEALHTLARVYSVGDVLTWA